LLIFQEVIMKLPKSKSAAGAATALALMLAALYCAPALAKKEQLPEVDKDGLHLIKDSKVAVAYAKPGASLDPYTRVMILDCFVDFQKDWQRDYNMNEIGLDGRVTDKDAEAIKKGLAEEFRNVFTKVLTEAGHEVVDQPGPDVLLLRHAGGHVQDLHSIGRLHDLVHGILRLGHQHVAGPSGRPPGRQPGIGRASQPRHQQGGRRPDSSFLGGAAHKAPGRSEAGSCCELTPAVPCRLRSSESPAHNDGAR